MAKLSAGGRTCLLEVILHKADTLNGAGEPEMCEKRAILRLMTDGKVLVNQKWKSRRYEYGGQRMDASGPWELHETGWKVEMRGREYVMDILKAKASGQPLSKWVKSIEVVNP